ncbi:peptidoglycan-binding protein [Streptosporangium lutulentum]
MTACMPIASLHVGITSPEHPGPPRPQADAPLSPAEQLATARFPLLRVGDSGTRVQDVQRRLNRLGFNAGTTSSEYRPALRAAVWAFQKANGLPPVNEVDMPTWQALSRPARLSRWCARGVHEGGDRSTAPAPHGLEGRQVRARHPHLDR